MVTARGPVEIEVDSLLQSFFIVVILAPRDEAVDFLGHRRDRRIEMPPQGNVAPAILCLLFIGEPEESGRMPLLRAGPAGYDTVLSWRIIPLPAVRLFPQGREQGALASIIR
jgi:hypothetical protein